MLAACRPSCKGQALPVSAFRVFRVGAGALAACAAVGIGNIQPKRTVRAQHPFQLTENLDKPCDVLLRRVLPPDLRVHAVIPQGIVGRACDAAMDALGGQLPQGAQRVAVDDGV